MEIESILETETNINDKKCIECMYCNEYNYCIRKKQKVKENDSCLHCVRRSERHAFELLIDKFISIYTNEDE